MLRQPTLYQVLAMSGPSILATVGAGGTRFWVGTDGNEVNLVEVETCGCGWTAHWQDHLSRQSRLRAPVHKVVKQQKNFMKENIAS